MDRPDQCDFRGKYKGALKGRPLSISRWRGLGGSTQRWAGQCGRMTAADFEARPWVANSGWPFGLDELEPYYVRAERLLGLGQFDPDQEIATDEDGSTNLITHDFRFPAERNLAKQLNDELAEAGNVRIVVNATVVAIETDTNGKVASGVRVDTGNGQRFGITARRIVLAANGIENVRLLLNSTSVSRNGLGNDADNVGRYFMDHPYFSAAVLPLDDANRIWPASTIDDYDDLFDRSIIKIIQFDPAWVERQELVNCGVMLVGRERYKAHPSYLSPAVDQFHSLLELLGERQLFDPETRRLLPRVFGNAFSILGAYSRSLRKEQRRLDSATVRATVEPVPDRDSRIRLSAEKDRYGVPLPEIDWRLGELERRSLLVMHDQLEKELGKHDVTLDQRLDPDPETGWPAPLQGGRHYIGTTRMHNSPELGVVDPNCRVHGLQNLFVTGSSVFATASYANPTLTIMALAIRLADHLRTSAAN
jgi:choline dehydrogenase-like flavoprotein